MLRRVSQQLWNVRWSQWSTAGALAQQKNFNTWAAPSFSTRRILFGVTAPPSHQGLCALSNSSGSTDEDGGLPQDGNWKGLFDELVVEDRSFGREELRRLVAEEWEHRISLADAMKEFLVDESDLAALPYFSFENPYTGQKTRYEQDDYQSM